MVFPVILSLLRMFVCLATAFLVFGDMNDNTLSPWPDGGKGEKFFNDLSTNERHKRQSGYVPFPITFFMITFISLYMKR